MLHFSHGEVNGFKVSGIPSGVKKVDPKDGRYILADSETTGNHHIVMDSPSVEVFEKNGVLYLKNDSAVSVECVIKERHDSITLEPGVWEIDRAQEFDYLEGMKRQVAD